MTKPNVYNNSVPSPRFVETFKDAAAGTVLDVGFGTAKEAIWLAERGWRVEGIDPGLQYYDTAVARAAEKGVELTLHQESLFSFQTQKTYDLVVCQMVLHFFAKEDVLGAIKKLKALTSPGGKVYISVFSDKNTTKRPTMFHRGELDQFFKDWEIEKSYEFETPPIIMPKNPTPTVFWFEYLLARKPKGVS